MADFVVHHSQNGSGQSASYSFGFRFEGPNGISLSHNVDILQGEAPNATAAFQIAKQRAANAKRDWLDAIEEDGFIGPVVLPAPQAVEGALVVNP